MNSALLTLAVVLAGLEVVAAAALVLRRTRMERAERRRRVLELRLRPIALAVSAGEVEAPTGLDEEEVIVMVQLLDRLGRLVIGDARERLTASLDRLGVVNGAALRLRSRRPQARAAAAARLGELGARRTAPLLCEALADPDPDVRAAAARSLGKLRHPGAVEPLVRALADATVPRSVASIALLGIGAEARHETRALLGSPSARVRTECVELLGLLGEPSDAELLVERLRDPSAAVRAAAARALGRLAASESAGRLRPLLADRIPFVRAAAAGALARVDDRDAAPLLLELARSDTFDAASAAAAALAHLVPERLAYERAGPHVAEAAGRLAARA